MFNIFIIFCLQFQHWNHMHPNFSKSNFQNLSEWLYRLITNSELNTASVISLVSWLGVGSTVARHTITVTSRIFHPYCHHTITVIYITSDFFPEMEVEDTGPDPSITENDNSLLDNTEAATGSSAMAAGLTDTLSGILYSSILCINKFNKLSVRWMSFFALPGSWCWWWRYNHPSSGPSEWFRVKSSLRQKLWSFYPVWAILPSFLWLGSWRR